MTRADFWFARTFLFSVAVAIAVAFGNPLHLKGNKLQELLGCIRGLVLGVAVVATVANFALDCQG